MWHGGNNYGRTASSGVITLYADDVLLHADRAPNEPKYTQLSRLQHLVADYAQVILSQDPTNSPLPYWSGTAWIPGAQQFVVSYPPSIYFLINQFGKTINVLFRNQNITMAGHSVLIYDNSTNLLWDSSDVSGIHPDSSHFIPVIDGQLNWETWSETPASNLSVITSVKPMEQLNITNAETIYLWYRSNVTLTQTSLCTIVAVETRRANALLFFLEGEYLGECDNHEHAKGALTCTIALDLSKFKLNQQYLFEILSISLGLDTGYGENSFEYKGIVGNVWLGGELLSNDQANLWEHQKDLVGEYLQIYTEQGASKVDWNTQWTKGINKPITWFQAHFDLYHLVRVDTNANPILLDAQGLNRGHAFINGNDLGLYRLIEGVCRADVPCCCQQAQINCLKPTQRYYHIPSDWLMAKNNLITVFDDLGTPSPGSVTIVQRVYN